MTAALRRWTELLRFRELIILLVARDLKVRYKRSALGMVWTLLNPLLQMIVYTLVFSTIMKVSVPVFPVFLMAGLLPWTLVTVSVTGSSYALLNNQGLIRKVAVPQMVYPIAVVCSKLVDVVLSVLPLALIAIILGRPPSASWLLMLPGFVLVSVFSVGLALVFSSMTVFYRDMRHLTDILMQVWFYLTPVIYPLSYLENLPYPWVARTLRANPATPFVAWFQQSVYEGRVPDRGTAVRAVVFAAVSLVVGSWAFLRSEHQHIHHF